MTFIVFVAAERLIVKFPSDERPGAVPSPGLFND
jgi:hypothetical protein